MKLFAVFILFSSLNAYSESIRISGVIDPEVNFRRAGGLEFKTNYSSFLDVELASGQMKRIYLQYNQPQILEEIEVKKVTVYAP